MDFRIFQVQDHQNDSLAPSMSSKVNYLFHTVLSDKSGNSNSWNILT